MYLLLGGLAGVLFRDLGTIRAQVKLWPIQTKVLDWGKLEWMVAGEQFDR